MKPVISKIIITTLVAVALISMLLLSHVQLSRHLQSQLFWFGACTLILITLVFAYKVKRYADSLKNQAEEIVIAVDKLLNAEDIDMPLNAADNTSLVNKVSKLILFDKQTQLPNKIEFCRRIKQLIQEYQQDPSPFAIVKIELSAFDEMLEVVGNKAGVSLMHLILNRLRATVPDNFTIAKLASNRLGLLMPNTSSHAVVRQHAENIIRAFNQPFHVEGQDFILTVHVGAACYPEHSSLVQGKKAINQLLANVVLALSYAKKSGKSAFQIYQQEYSQARKVHAEIEGALHHALLGNEFELYYQPQVDIAQQKIIGAEALLRWKNPKLGMVSPDKFIPIAEANGMIVEIGDWVLLSAFAAALQLNSEREEPLVIAINLSVRQFYENDLATKIRQLLKHTRCKPEWIKLEITESLLLDKSDEILKVLIDIADMGIAISLDDFGTGYSSLSYLTRYPISQIKIDRSFMTDIPIFLEKCALVKLIVKVADTLHFDLVAEGVETLEQLEWLRQTSCNVVQGYYFYKPMPYFEFDKTLKTLAAQEQNADVKTGRYFAF